MKKYFAGIASMSALLLMISCSGDDKKPPVEENPDPEFIRAADVSFLPEIEASGTVYYHDGTAQDPVTTLKNAGCNYIRLRLWKNPSTGHSTMAEVKTMAERVRAAGMKVWLTVHYSDTWADPGNQAIPAEWSALSLTQMKTAVADYTSEILTQIHPDLIQIGNETNDGFLWPMGRLTTNESQYLELVAAASGAVRADSPNTKIMLHFAGMTGAEWFFNKTAGIDFDYIGLSYYPIWHGKNLGDVKNTIDLLGNAHQKPVIIAETAYPFTLGWDDWTNNTVGLEGQLIPAFPATPYGQKSFLNSLKGTIKTTEWGIGFAYWGTEWVAWNGNESTQGSSAENQALWDFDHNALEALDAFAE